MSKKIKITFPDGKSIDAEKGITGYQVAADISQSLADQSVAIMLNDTMCDISKPIEDSAPDSSCILPLSLNTHHMFW